MSPRGTTLSILALLVLGTGAWIAWGASQAGAQAEEQPQPTTDKVEPKPMSAPVLMQGDALPPKPQRSPRDISAMTQLPDGTYIRNLNGVRFPLSWQGPSFSPIVGVRRTDKGVDFWVHENGLQSTTWMVEGMRSGVPFREPQVLYFALSEKTFGVDPRQQPKRT